MYTDFLNSFYHVAISNHNIALETVLTASVRFFQPSYNRLVVDRSSYVSIRIFLLFSIRTLLLYIFLPSSTSCLADIPSNYIIGAYLFFSSYFDCISLAHLNLRKETVLRVYPAIEEAVNRCLLVEPQAQIWYTGISPNTVYGWNLRLSRYVPENYELAHIVTISTSWTNKDNACIMQM